MYPKTKIRTPINAAAVKEYGLEYSRLRTLGASSGVADCGPMFELSI